MDKNRNLTGIVIGVILIVVGILSLFGRLFTFINWDTMWPLGVVGAGAVFFVVMVLGGKTRGSLAVPGSILVIVGLILLVLNSTDRWETWAYAWTLIISAVGLGNLINGIWSGDTDLRKRGLIQVRDGLIAFLVFGVIMEFIFSITGVASWGSTFFWAALLTLMGLYLLITRLLQLRKPEGQKVDLFWPVLIIGVGILALLVSLNWLPKENLAMAANLWPLLLIVAGVGLILRSRSAWVGASLGVLVVAAVFVVVFAGGSLGIRSTPFWSFDPGLFDVADVSAERITGSGSVITENRPVSGFDRVQLGIPAELEIQQGSTESLTVSGEDNILALLVTNISGSKLTIRYPSNTDVYPTRPVQITLTVKNLAEIQNSSTGKVTVRPIKTGDFHAALSSSGNIEIDEIQAGKVTADLTSSGDILIKGSANQLDLRVSSSGLFQAGDFQVQEATVRLSSSGDVTVWVVKDLSVNISSSGDVAYYGDPTVNSRLTSSGRLIHKGGK